MLKKKVRAHKSSGDEVAGGHKKKAPDWGYIVPVPGVRYYRFPDRKASERAGLPGRKVESGSGKEPGQP